VFRDLIGCQMSHERWTDVGAAGSSIGGMAISTQSRSNDPIENGASSRELTKMKPLAGGQRDHCARAARAQASAAPRQPSTNEANSEHLVRRIRGRVEVVHRRPVRSADASVSD
jgi:hypothetical protein